VGERVLGEQGGVARVKPLSVVEITFAPLPLPASPGKVSQHFRNTTAIRQKLACLFKVTLRGVVIFQAGVVVTSLSQDGLAQIRLKRARGFRSLPCFFAKRIRRLES